MTPQCSADRYVRKSGSRDAYDQLRKLRSDATRNDAQRGRDLVHQLMSEPLPLPPPGERWIPATEKCDSKPIPVHLQRELDAHKRRDPLFDPHGRPADVKELRRWFDRHAPATD
jgi:hypothetical protein